MSNFDLGVTRALTEGRIEKGSNVDDAAEWAAQHLDAGNELAQSLFDAEAGRPNVRGIYGQLKAWAAAQP